MTRPTLEVARALALLQGAILLLSTIEASVFGGLGPIVLLTGAGAILTLAAARGLAKAKPWARRLTIISESALLVMAGIDLAISLIVTHTLLAPVPILTRLAIPATMIWILRRSAVRQAFYDRPQLEQMGANA